MRKDGEVEGEKTFQALKVSTANDEKLNPSNCYLQHYT